VPQLVPPWSAQVFMGSTLPVGTLVQTPRVAVRAHDLQALAHAVAQQTPCAQMLDSHSAAAEQVAPFSFLPHELTLHTRGATQFAVTVQAAKHLVPLHW
jgi:hypothetical protein